MYGATKHKLDRLEKRHKEASFRCPHCGHSPHGVVEYEVEWADDDRAEPQDEWCPECGKQMTIVVTWMEG